MDQLTKLKKAGYKIAKKENHFMDMEFNSMSMEEIEAFREGFSAGLIESLLEFPLCFENVHR